jgi:hypothetical protein
MEDYLSDHILEMPEWNHENNISSTIRIGCITSADYNLTTSARSINDLVPRRTGGCIAEMDYYVMMPSS